MRVKCLCFLLCCISLLVSDLKAEQKIYPWDTICTRYDEGNLLFEGNDDSRRYDLTKNLCIRVSDSTKEELSKCRVLIQKWDNQTWKEEIPSNADLTGEKITVLTEKLSFGFYKLSIMSILTNSIRKEYYFIICPKWKEEFIVYGKSQKQAYESTGNYCGIEQSIMISHYDNLIKQASNSTCLSSELMERLSLSAKCRLLQRQGQLPYFATGLNKLHFKRFPGANYTDMVVYVPKDYSPARKWPVYVYTDSKRWGVDNYSNEKNLKSDRIEMWWHSIPDKIDALYADIGWKDFVCVKKVMKERLNIDEDRFYLYGECYNGMTAFAVSANYPDTWAHCTIGGGNSYRHLIGNMYNIPITYSTDHNENPERVADCNFCMKCFQYYGCRYEHLNYDELKMLLREEWRDVINHRPKDIYYTIESLQNPQAYWMTILGRDDENFTARIKTSVNGQVITVDTMNVDAYKIDLKTAPLDCSKQVEIIENGKSTIIQPQDVYIHKSEKYENAKIIKDGRIHGPIRDVFTEGYTVLYTQGKNEDETKFIKNIALYIAANGPCISESEYNQKPFIDQNIIIIGKCDNSSLLARLSGQLPVDIQADHVSFEGKTLTGDGGVIMIYPNPNNPEKYLALFVALSDAALKEIPVLWEKKIYASNADIAVFTTKAEGDVKIICLECFNTLWAWHAQWNMPLIEIFKEHPKWQWKQWVAYVIRKQMQADVVIAEDMFENTEVFDFKVLTLRELNQVVKNQWIVKIRLKGKELKSLLMQSVTRQDKNNDIKIKAASPVIEGIGIFKYTSNSDGLQLSDLQDNVYYSVALPYKLINGSRIGVVLLDYEITGDEYLLPMIYQYMRNSEDSQIDEELNKMCPSVL